MRKLPQNMRDNQRLLVGWREWCGLPKLGIPLIKAKIDTGALTSAIHAFDIVPFERAGKLWVRFFIHPVQGNDTIVVPCTARVIDQRSVMSSNGHKEHRYVIQTELQMGERCWSIDLTLSNRDPLRFRILLGRAALRERVMIDPNHSYHLRKSSAREQKKHYLSPK